ncbi:MAG: M28 family peptidase [Bacteroidota bacterium]
MHALLHRTRVLVLFLLFPGVVSAQFGSNRQALIDSLRNHIRVLASDSFGGREPGTPGELLAMEYISSRYRSIGLETAGSDGYYQAFSFTRSIKAAGDCRLSLDKKALLADKDFSPMAYSADGSASGPVFDAGYGMVVPSLNYNDYTETKRFSGSIFIIDASTPDKAGPHSKYAAAADLRSRIDTAIAKGAAGIVFYSADSAYTAPSLSSRMRVTPCTVPVLYFSGNIDALKTAKTVSMKSGLVRESASGHNIAGFINNKASTTIIIGAHYDHLGHGGEESLHRGEPAVHNGADDNASGVAGLIELARYLKQSGPKSNNYLFVAFSGEEKGLLGSAYYTRNATVDLKAVNYMLNMDMIGRLKTDDPVLLVSGAGTSDAWKITMNYLSPQGFRVKTSESGIGPSDHTSFYLKDIPVLHFFSGTHSDYHKPSDDEHLINYPGEADILGYIASLIESLDDKGKIAFVKTKDSENGDTPRFKVTLGVVPDYGFEGEGMRIDGVSEGKPAFKAGLKSGDIVQQIGSFKVLDMMRYMKALGGFSKGEKTRVGIVREGKPMELDVEF